MTLSLYSAIATVSVKGGFTEPRQGRLGVLLGLLGLCLGVCLGAIRLDFENQGHFNDFDSEFLIASFMRCFTQVITTSIGDDVLRRARDFAEKVAPTVGTGGVYMDTHQKNVTKIQQDHYVSKVGEEAVKQVFEHLGKTIQGPDYKIYQGKQKSWDSDLVVEGIDLAVKTQTKERASQFGLSWTFQASGQRTDPILNQPNAWVCFVEFDEQHRQCCVYPAYQIKELVFGEPKLAKLKGLKKIIYARTLPPLKPLNMKRLNTSKSLKIT
ncbi:hypothetical protein L3556_11965 [Candidatus Synechococcus calcipolaris G9]|uniref:Uncharacterized protein n=1 Tax=Candidatus Synechococcus calcipolaris G9 TaxID=1497997 RepID=A0ABT6F1D7_9SYNE|nr:hypothetical protein [Candidatus Synechococcus calcipolaris]MDG2991642.1 hypothetical protein [Candidatus Synechococcus calcipolaris G9]